MRLMILSVVLMIVSVCSQAATQSSGSIVKLVGKAWKLSKSLPKPVELKSGSSVSSGDVVQTE
ncbi:MAG: hypothetical protein EP326_10360, partial [Deltaproteobacteria bacterium]